MFVLATMTAPTGSGPIKIRNMSSSGALIEGEALPQVGEHLLLRRGELSVSGHVTWRQQGRAGLRFDREIEVANWLPAGSGGQQQIDRTFHDLKSSPRSIASLPQPTSNTPIGGLDMLQVADTLDALADTLAEDPDVVQAYGPKLQVLDIASQLIRRFATRSP